MGMLLTTIRNVFTKPFKLATLLLCLLGLVIILIIAPEADRHSQTEPGPTATVSTTARPSLFTRRGKLCRPARS